MTLAVLPQPECPKPVPQMPDLALSRSMVPKRDGGSAEDYELSTGRVIRCEWSIGKDLPKQGT